MMTKAMQCFFLTGYSIGIAVLSLWSMPGLSDSFRLYLSSDVLECMELFPPEESFQHVLYDHSGLIDLSVLVGGSHQDGGGYILRQIVHMPIYDYTSFFKPMHAFIQQMQGPHVDALIASWRGQKGQDYRLPLCFTVLKMYGKNKHDPITLAQLFDPAFLKHTIPVKSIVVQGGAKVLTLAAIHYIIYVCQAEPTYDRICTVLRHIFPYIKGLTVSDASHESLLYKTGTAFVLTCDFLNDEGCVVSPAMAEILYYTLSRQCVSEKGAHFAQLFVQKVIENKKLWMQYAPKHAMTVPEGVWKKAYLFVMGSLLG